MKRGDRLLLTGLLLLLLGSGLYVYWLRQQADGQLLAEILQDGQLIRQVDLSNVAEPYQLRIDDGSGGYNLIAVEPGRIRVIEANCPEQVDVRQGWISQPHQSLVCLPHRLVIRLVAKGKPDVDGIVK